MKILGQTAETERLTMSGKGYDETNPQLGKKLTGSRGRLAELTSSLEEGYHFL